MFLFLSPAVVFDSSLCLLSWQLNPDQMCNSMESLGVSAQELLQQFELWDLNRLEVIEQWWHSAMSWAQTWRQWTKENQTKASKETKPGPEVDTIVVNIQDFVECFLAWGQSQTNSWSTARTRSRREGGSALVQHREEDAADNMKFARYSVYMWGWSNGII